jgi:hypothetical protein
MVPPLLSEIVGGRMSRRLEVTSAAVPEPTLGCSMRAKGSEVLNQTGFARQAIELHLSGRRPGSATDHHG